MKTRNELGHELPEGLVLGPEAPVTPSGEFAAAPQPATAVAPDTLKPPKRQIRLSPDQTRFDPAPAHGMTPRMIADLALMGDGAVLGRLAESAGSGLLPIVAELEPRAVIDEAQPRSPVEEIVLRSMVLAAGQQRHLLDLALRVGLDESRQRYEDLAIRAGREVTRAATAWNALRRPPSVVVESGAQANVVGGNQVIHRAPASAPEGDV